MTSRFDTLRSTRVLAGCSSAQLRSLLPYIDEVVVPAGCTVATEGRYCSQFSIVAEGRLRAASIAACERRLEVGDSVGWHESWQRSVNAETVVAESTARLLIMSRAQFRAVKAILAPPGDELPTPAAA